MEKWHDGTSDLPKPIFSCVSSVRTFTNVTFDKYIMNTCAHVHMYGNMEYHRMLKWNDHLPVW